MLLLNFTHPLSPAQLDQLAVFTGHLPKRTLGEMVQFDPQAPLHPQILAIVDRLALDATTWQTAPMDDRRWTTRRWTTRRWTTDDGRPCDKTTQ